MMLSDLLSLVFPRNCIHCNRALTSKEEHLCIACKVDLPLTDDHLNKHNELYQKFAFEDKIKSASAYMFFYQKGVAQSLLHYLKYKNQRELGTLLGDWLASTLVGINPDLVLPVPLHRRKEMQRGYNQSELIAKRIGELLSIPVATDLIRRNVLTSSQTKKAKVMRWNDLQNVYSHVVGEIVDKKILIVDDVVTTGATVGMLCERLVQASVAEIHIVAVARGK